MTNVASPTAKAVARLRAEPPAGRGRSELEVDERTVLSGGQDKPQEGEDGDHVIAIDRSLASESGQISCAGERTGLSRRSQRVSRFCSQHDEAGRHRRLEILDGGTFATTYRLTFGSGRRVVAKDV